MKFAVLFLVLTPAMLADLTAVKQEPNSEKRSDLALSEADREVDLAREAYKKSDDSAFRSALERMMAAVQLSYDSLQSTGKNARKHPKYFKRADLKMRDLVRRIDGLEHEVGYDDRQHVLVVKNKILQLDEQIVLEIMKK